METVYSLSGDVPPVDDVDGGRRCRPVAGRADLGAIRQVCSIRKISAGGAIVHVDGPVEPGERLELELMTGEQLGRHHRLAARRRGRPALRRADRRVRDDRAGHRQPARRAPPDAARRAGRARPCWRPRRAPNWSPPATSRRAAPSSTCRSRSTPEERVLVTLDGLRAARRAWCAGRASMSPASPSCPSCAGRS